MKMEGFEKAENFERFNEASFIVNNRTFREHYKISLTKNIQNRKRRGCSDFLI